MNSNAKLIVLLIGSTGNVGLGILKAFQQSDRYQTAIKNNQLEIRAAYHTSKSKELIEKCSPSIKPVPLDIDHLDVHRSIDEAFVGVNCLFLQTGYFTKSIIQSKTILDCAKAAKIEFILHGGVLAQQTTINESFAFHILVEKYIECLNFKYCHLHPAVYMQVLLGYAGERIVDREKNQLELYWKPDYLLTWVDCDDVGRVAASILADYHAHHTRVYSLTSDQLTMEQVTKVLSEQLHCSLEYRLIEPEDWATSVCEKILTSKDLSSEEKFTRCHYIHAIKKAFIRHNNETFDEQWRLYPDLNQLLTSYQWNKTANTLEDFVRQNREYFSI